MKTCNKCGEEKKNSEFSKDKTRKGGLDYTCKLCKKEYRELNGENWKKYSKDWYLKNKDKRKRYYQDNKEEIAEISKKYHKEHREKILKKKKIYYKNLDNV